MALGAISGEVRTDPIFKTDSIVGSGGESWQEMETAHVRIEIAGDAEGSDFVRWT